MTREEACKLRDEIKKRWRMHATVPYGSRSTGYVVRVRTLLAPGGEIIFFSRAEALAWAKKVNERLVHSSIFRQLCEEVEA